MSELILFFVGVISFFSVMLMIEPYRYLPEFKAKKKRVGSTYWGVYAGQPVKEPEAERTIELKEPSRKEKHLVGSSTYAQGRGVKMSGRG